MEKEAAESVSESAAKLEVLAGLNDEEFNKDFGTQALILGAMSMCTNEINGLEVLDGTPHLAVGEKMKNMVNAVDGLRRIVFKLQGGPLANSVMETSTLSTLISLVPLCSDQLRKMAKTGAKNGTDVSKEENSEMLNWAKLRLAAVSIFSVMANSDQRIGALIGTDLPLVCVKDILDCPSTNFDLNVIRACCELMRNLCIPADVTSDKLVEVGAVPALMIAATGKARDQNGAAAAAAALRLLLSRSPNPPTVAAHLAPGAPLILKMPLDKTHPFVRVELARTCALALPHIVTLAIQMRNVALVRPQSQDEPVVLKTPDSNDDPTESLEALSLSKDSVPQPPSPPESEHEPACAAAAAASQVTAATDAVSACLSTFGETAGIEFVCFLLASEDPVLHAEAVTALLSLRRAYKANVGVTQDPMNTGSLVAESTPLDIRLAELTSKATDEAGVQELLAETGVWSSKSYE
mmetsp:Transcript_11726/g.15483  ORF Transcript_11726/g.15483 Transcript_11726/m.15483 type:complete len:466 (-) Transcript_11726:119-1516(-)